MADVRYIVIRDGVPDLPIGTIASIEKFGDLYQSLINIGAIRVATDEDVRGAREAKRDSDRRPGPDRGGVQSPGE